MPSQTVIQTTHGNILLVGNKQHRALISYARVGGRWREAGIVSRVRYEESGNGTCSLVDDLGTRLTLMYEDTSVLPHVISSVRAVAAAAGAAHSLPASALQFIPLPRSKVTTPQKGRERGGWQGEDGGGGGYDTSPRARVSNHAQDSFLPRRSSVSGSPEYTGHEVLPWQIL